MSSSLKDRLIAGIAGLSVLVGGLAVAGAASADGPQTKASATETLDGSLSWGIKQTFRNYFWGPYADGATTASGGASVTANDSSGLFTYSLAEGQSFDAANPSDLTFEGSVNLTAHAGALNFTLSDPVLDITGTTGVLKLTVTTDPAGGTPTNYGQISFATIANITVTGDELTPTITATGLALTAEAVPILQSYSAGTVLDDLTVSLTKTVTTVDPDPTASATTPTDDPTATQSPYASATPSTPTTSTSPTASAQTYDKGALNWGIKSTFISYVSRFGTVTAGDGATGTFSFPLASGQDIDLDDLTSLAFTGNVHLSAHDGVLDITLSNLSVVQEEGKWVLKATASSRSMGTGEMVEYGEIVIAELDGINVAVDDDVATITFASAVLSEAAVPVFGSYAAGTEMDLPAITLTAATAPTTEPTEGPTTSAPTTAPTTSAPTTPGNTASATPAPSASSSATDVKECTVDTAQTRVTSGSFSWGIKSSFTTYIRSSIANGGWTLSGATWNGSNFGFSASGGLYNTSTRTGTLYYTGSVHFTGHDGVLDLTMSNPTLKISGNSATLSMIVKGSDMAGTVTNYGTVAIANVTLSNVSVSDSKLSYSSSSVALTSTGAKAMAGFYSEGEAMDLLSGSASLTPNSQCDPETGELSVYDAYGNLAYTGTNTAGVALAGLLMIGLGATALVVRRRGAKA
ncbi:HtaA domain-containing protein [Changpingibacter yushuensis]|uniref:HtaA domain-containing protein n=1 Tax=Changpingibacter yushuensis TaxID=2758440 RepID=UPI0015F54B21|nr:HtaA domain-containing protein [Changpingibacter yushuensis]